MRQVTLGKTVVVIGFFVSACASYDNHPYEPSPAPVRESVEVCHGGPADRRAIEVDDQALAEHLAHGDTIFGYGLGPRCEGGLTFRIDASLRPSVPALAGPIGGPVGVVVGPNNQPDEFIVDQVQLRPRNTGELNAFIARYGGLVLQEETVPVVRGYRAVERIPGPAQGWRLIRVDLQRSPLADLPRVARAAKISEGAFRFSSEEVARAVALQLREVDLRVSPNFLLYSFGTPDHPNDADGNIDFTSLWWMTDDDNAFVSGDQGLSTGVARAWSYLRNTGLPPVHTEEVWFPAEVAVVDGSFNLDPVTGLGSRDYQDCLRPPSAHLRCDSADQPPLQLDLLEFDNLAGTTTGSWHGERMVGTCCAFPGNRFGGAGTGGEYVHPFPIRVGQHFDLVPPGVDITTHQWTAAQAIRAAAFRGIPVINLSLGARCDWTWSLESNLCVLGVDEDNLQQAVLTATAFGSVVVAGAGNGTDIEPGDQKEDNNIDSQFWVPCEHQNVICVGAVDRNGQNVFNWGKRVAIWAPGESHSNPIDRQRSTVTPASAAADAGDVGVDEVAVTSATSAATAYVSGVVGILKSVRPSLRWDDVRSILQETANCSLAFPGNPCAFADKDPKAHFGWVDVLRAVQRVRQVENAAPTVKIISPFQGEKTSWLAPLTFTMQVRDLPNPDGFTGVISVKSDPPGLDCSIEGSGLIQTCLGNTGPQVQTIGPYTVTATATDEFGAQSVSEPITVEVTNGAPNVTLLSPPSGSVHFTDQKVPFRVGVIDADGEPYVNDCFDLPGGPCLQWTSSLSGPLEPPAMEGLTDFAVSLSNGTHIIMVRARDGQGAEDSESVTVQVLPGVGNPTALILSVIPPAVRTGEPVVLTGRGEDGGIDLPGSSLRWSSDRDGILGIGSPLSVVLSGPQGEGFFQHVITLRVTDSDGNTDTDQIVVSVGQIQ